MASPDRKKKQFGFNRILSSIKNSWNGLKSAYKNEQSVYIHLVCTVILLLLSFLLEISLTQWLIIIAIIGLTLVVELLNTAIESTVDLVTEEFHPLAKVAKDNLEEKLGKSVVSSQNKLNYKYVDDSKLIE